MPPCIEAQPPPSSLAAGTVLHWADADVESSGPGNVEPPDERAQAGAIETRVVRDGVIRLDPPGLAAEAAAFFAGE
jgi:hypothetical protein